MTQEQKDLLLKDLCARVPYGVKVRSKIPINQNEYKEIIGKVTSVHYNISIVQVEGFDVIADYEPHFEIKPYLFPLSSMTEEQKEEFNSYFADVPYYGDNGHEHVVPYYFVELLMEFFHKNHIDNNGLIPKGLAIDATGLNIY